MAERSMCNTDTFNGKEGKNVPHSTFNVQKFRMSEITATNSSASQTLKHGNPAAAAVSAPAVQGDQWEGQLSSQIVIEPARGWIAQTEPARLVGIPGTPLGLRTGLAQDKPAEGTNDGRKRSLVVVGRAKPWQVYDEPQDCPGT